MADRQITIGRPQSWALEIRGRNSIDTQLANFECHKNELTISPVLLISLLMYHIIIITGTVTIGIVIPLSMNLKTWLFFIICILLHLKMSCINSN